MESIPGFRTDLSTSEFLEQLHRDGLVLTGQTGDLAPADGKLYALRDVTGTVQSIPLIASSVMSKKIAAGAQAILLDVKLGLGAFMPTLEDARRLARLMVSIANLAGRQAVALLSDMNQPLGFAVGNALEVREAIRTLQGCGPQDFREHCLVVAGHMLSLGGIAENENAGRVLAETALNDGRGWNTFRKLVIAQGGDVNYVDHPERLPSAPVIDEIPAPRTGFLSEINARMVGETSVVLGAGRVKKGDPIDHAVGIVLHHKVGDRVQEGEPLFSIHARNREDLEQARQRLLDSHQWSIESIEPLPLFYGVIKQTES